MYEQTRKMLSGFVVLPAVAAIATLCCAETQTGEWTMNHSDSPGKVQFSLEGSRGEGHHFSTSSDWNTNDFQGLDWAGPGKHDVRFTIHRDAGEFVCDGFMRDGEGAGLFTFNSNPQYIRQMESLGFADVTDEKLISFTFHDVSLAYAREIKSAATNVTSADKLIAFRIHGVTAEFIKGLRDAGLNVTDSDKLVAFRIHGVSPEYVQQLARLGYSHPEPSQLIALRIHGVTPEYIEKLRSHGIQDLTLEQIVKLRIHGID